MARKRRHKTVIKRLVYPTWFNIVFYLFTIVIPLLFITIEGFTSPYPSFRWTFGVIVGLLLLWSLIYKFIITNYEKNMKQRKIALEHDYEIEVGNGKKIKYLWFSNEQLLTIIQVCQITLWGLLISVFAIGIKVAALKISYLTIIIAISYIIAYITKFIVISALKGEDEDLKGDDNNVSEGNE